VKYNGVSDEGNMAVFTTRFTTQFQHARSE